MHDNEKTLDDFIWEDFKSLMNNPLLFNSYIDYFLILVDWIKKHKSDLKYSVYWNRLGPILDVDINDYISKEPEILLNQEPKRMFSLKPDTVDSFVMRLCDTLWDLVKLRSGKDCPRCKDDELNYVVAEVLKTTEKKLILECDTCGRALNIDGTEWSDGVAVIYPANEITVNKYLGAN
ncbi:hypothetical protein [Paenibacillus tyrfis]|uniref:Uncharacterized protein n=1 Tax=Paenibacillus tyrfis TaxID=1501230 RepID=A0A081P2J3_9BACL|nr:hypothetical protein [Paenibacillus tyrfis]KEQ24916.1 hypothetical protein ET33_06020 [Paenibacillus tyrfis]